jgi:hypothetical protein
VRDELLGKRVSCPHCKSGFLAAANGAGPAAANGTAPTKAKTAASSSAGGMDFLDGLSDGPATTAGPAVAVARPKLVKKQQPPIGLFIAGGAGAVVLLFAIVIAVVVSQSGPSAPARKWGLTLGQRQQVFYKLIEAVDLYGMTPEGKQAWHDLQQKYKIGDDATKAILEEGFNSSGKSISRGWPEPDLPSGKDASVKTNRRTWNRVRTEMGREPMLD